MSELADNIVEYIQNSQALVETFQKEASEAKAQLEVAEKRPFIQKEAAIQLAGTLIGKGLISANNLTQTIDDLCADPLGVITKISKVASVQMQPVPSMGIGSNVKKSISPAISKEKLSNADKALLNKLHISY